MMPIERTRFDTESAYETTIKRLDDPDSWDQNGIIRDASQACRDAGLDEASAVIDWLLTQWRSAEKQADQLRDRIEDAGAESKFYD